MFKFISKIIQRYVAWNEKQRIWLEEFKKKNRSEHWNPKYPKRDYVNRYYYCDRNGFHLDMERAPELFKKFREQYPEMFNKRKNK